MVFRMFHPQAKPPAKILTLGWSSCCCSFLELWDGKAERFLILISWSWENFWWGKLTIPKREKHPQQWDDLVIWWTPPFWFGITPFSTLESLVRVCGYPGAWSTWMTKQFASACWGWIWCRWQPEITLGDGWMVQKMWNMKISSYFLRELSKVVGLGTDYWRKSCGCCGCDLVQNPLFILMAFPVRFSPWLLLSVDFSRFTSSFPINFWAMLMIHKSNEPRLERIIPHGFLSYDFLP